MLYLKFNFADFVNPYKCIFEYIRLLDKQLRPYYASTNLKFNIT